mmetsp:Transcript_13123/g.39714  ORF Transcript_13123/g.39714 Transcript_13123/m.39714 type:complete len:215 (+) Transcript_13123:1229-1873(+)
MRDGRTTLSSLLSLPPSRSTYLRTCDMAKDRPSQRPRSRRPPHQPSWTPSSQLPSLQGRRKPPWSRWSLRPRLTSQSVTRLTPWLTSSRWSKWTLPTTPNRLLHQDQRVAMAGPPGASGAGGLLRHRVQLLPSPPHLPPIWVPPRWCLRILQCPCRTLLRAALLQKQKGHQPQRCRGPPAAEHLVEGTLAASAGQLRQPVPAGRPLMWRWRQSS